MRVTGLVDAFYNPPGPAPRSFCSIVRNGRAATRRPATTRTRAAFFRRDDLPPLAFASTFAAVEHLPPGTDPDGARIIVDPEATP